jgi:hypothetical protein
MRHLGARDKGKARGLRQAEQLLEPAASHLFDHGLGRTAGMDRRVLVPGRHQPVRRKRRRQGAADHPAEEAAAARAKNATGRIAHEIVDHLCRVGAVLRQRLGKASA